MFEKYIKAGATALLLGTAGAGAAPIDLPVLGFEEGTPSYTGSGGVFYDDFIQLLTDDVISLTGRSASGVFLSYDPTGFLPNTADVFYDDASGGSGDFEQFDIVDRGDDENNTLEFLLLLANSDLGGGTEGLGQNAILRIRSTVFDFSTQAPFDFFGDNSNNDGEYLADVDITLTALEPTTPIPLPPSALLLLGALGAFGAMRRNRRTG